MSMAITTQPVEFVVCVASEGYDDLQARKVHRMLPDAKARQVGCLRVIDDSGEDYLYPAERFVVLGCPKEAQERLLEATAQ
jgi:uncharacterized Fe-S cluster-containing radical SAM superfamily protein